MLWPSVALAGAVIAVFAPGPVSEAAIWITAASATKSLVEAFTAVVIFVTGERRAETVEREIVLADRQITVADRNITLERLRIQRAQIENDGDRQRAALIDIKVGRAPTRR